jgi:hypothetical protein
MFLLFDGEVRRALLLSGPVGPLLFVGEKHQQNSKAWSLGFTKVCGRLLALSSKLRVPMGKQIQWV